MICVIFGGKTLRQLQYLILIICGFAKKDIICDQWKPGRGQQPQRKPLWRSVRDKVKKKLSTNVEKWLYVWMERPLHQMILKVLEEVLYMVRNVTGWYLFRIQTQNSFAASTPSRVTFITKYFHKKSILYLFQCPG